MKICWGPAWKVEGEQRTNWFWFQNIGSEIRILLPISCLGTGNKKKNGIGNMVSMGDHSFLALIFLLPCDSTSWSGSKILKLTWCGSVGPTNWNQLLLIPFFVSTCQALEEVEFWLCFHLFPILCFSFHLPSRPYKTLLLHNYFVLSFICAQSKTSVFYICWWLLFLQRKINESRKLAKWMMTKNSFLFSPCFFFGYR